MLSILIAGSFFKLFGDFLLVDVASHFIGRWLFKLVVESATTAFRSSSISCLTFEPPNCFNKFSAIAVFESFCDSIDWMSSIRCKRRETKWKSPNFSLIVLLTHSAHGYRLLVSLYLPALVCCICIGMPLMLTVNGNSDEGKSLVKYFKRTYCTRWELTILVIRHGLLIAELHVGWSDLLLLLLLLL